MTKLNLSALSNANKQAESSVRGGKKDNIISRVLKYVIANHKDLTVTPTQLQEYIKLSNFQNYFKVDGLPFTQKFSSLEGKNGLFEWLEKNGDKVSGATAATKKTDIMSAITIWLERAKPYVNSHFLNDGDTGQMSLNHDKLDRFAYSCSEDDNGNIVFKLKDKKASQYVYDYNSNNRYFSTIASAKLRPKPTFKGGFFFAQEVNNKDYLCDVIIQ